MPIRDFLEYDSAFDLAELAQNGIQVYHKFLSFVFAAELLTDVVQLLVEDWEVIGVYLNLSELIFVVGAALTEDLAYANELSEQVKFLWLLILEVLLLIVEEEFDERAARVQSVVLGFLLSIFSHWLDHIVLEVTLVAFFSLHEHSFLLTEPQPEDFKLTKHVPGSLPVHFFSKWSLLLPNNFLKPINVYQ